MIRRAELVLESKVHGIFETTPFNRAEDLLLATATHPTLKGIPLNYASPEEIADAWGRNTTGAAIFGTTAPVE